MLSDKAVENDYFPEVLLEPKACCTHPEAVQKGRGTMQLSCEYVPWVEAHH
jgi:hypothetical protein